MYVKINLSDTLYCQTKKFESKRRKIISPPLVRKILRFWTSVRKPYTSVKWKKEPFSYVGTITTQIKFWASQKEICLRLSKKYIQELSLSLILIFFRCNVLFNTKGLDLSELKLSHIVSLNIREWSPGLFVPFHSTLYGVDENGTHR